MAGFLVGALLPSHPFHQIEDQIFDGIAHLSCRASALWLLKQRFDVGLAFFSPGIALALGRALAGLFFGVSVADPFLFGAVALLLAAVALLASAGPAWRAARVSPSEALQE
jgi:hypothetical protein